MRRRLITNATLVTPDSVLPDHALFLEHGLIAAIGPAEELGDGYCGDVDVIDAAGAYVLPGLIDLHTDTLEKEITPRPSADFPVDVPIRSHTDAIVVFDDVFVPWERVFLCGESKWAATAVYNFAYLHRHTATTYHIAWVELLVGLGALMADYNGITKASNVRDQLVELIYYLNTMKSLCRASCMDYVVQSGLAIPNPATANVAKYFYANNYHNIVKIVEDLSGALLTTAPGYQDWVNPETGKYLEHYLGGRNGASAEARLRILQTLRHYPCLGTEIDVNNIHAEGSLMAERLTIWGEGRKDLELYKQLGNYLAGVTTMTDTEYQDLCRNLSYLGKGDAKA